MGCASYEIVESEQHWSVRHDGADQGDFLSKEAAFEAAFAAAATALRLGHEVRVLVPGNDGRPNWGVPSN